MKKQGHLGGGQMDTLNKTQGLEHIADHGSKGHLDGIVSPRTA